MSLIGCRILSIISGVRRSTPELAQYTLVMPFKSSTEGAPWECLSIMSSVSLVMLPGVRPPSREPEYQRVLGCYNVLLYGAP